MKIVERYPSINKYSKVGDIIIFSDYKLKIVESELCVDCFFFTKKCPTPAYCKKNRREDNKNILYQDI